ncbi:EamA family transporter, partial [Klebsiella pneumoniae]|nr:EamA family transporter [Klebsiella pneumoniae]
IIWVVGGDGGISWDRLVANISSNPLSYGLAFSGAIIWAVYCNVTKRYADGKNGVALFFMLTAIVLWIKYGMSAEPALAFGGGATLELCVT